MERGELVEETVLQAYSKFHLVVLDIKMLRVAFLLSIN